MIRQDYQPYLQELKKELTQFGYSGVRENELLAEFYLFSDWVLVLDCEKYYGPSWTIFLTNGNAEYAVWILMKAFENLTGKAFGKPTIANQIAFLIQEKERIFNAPDFFEKEYTKLNEGEPAA